MATINISATTFAKFCAATGPAKVTVVRNAKQQYTVKGYQQGPDYWKPFRDELLRVLRRAGADRNFNPLLTSGSDLISDRLPNYRRAAAGALKWIGRKDITLVRCVPRPWIAGELHVKVNPEFSAKINGRLHVVKLWLSTSDALSKPRTDTLLHLLDLTHGAGVSSGATPGVLDVVNGKLFTPTRQVPGIDALLAGEAASFEEIWKQIGDDSSAATG